MLAFESGLKKSRTQRGSSCSVLVSSCITEGFYYLKTHCSLLCFCNLFCFETHSGYTERWFICTEWQFAKLSFANRTAKCTNYQLNKCLSWKWTGIQTQAEAKARVWALLPALRPGRRLWNVEHGCEEETFADSENNLSVVIRSSLLSEVDEWCPVSMVTKWDLYKHQECSSWTRRPSLVVV